MPDGNLVYIWPTTILAGDTCLLCRLSSGRGFLKSSLVPLRITLSCLLLVFPFTVSIVPALPLLLSITNPQVQLTQLLLKSTYSDTLHVTWQATLDVICTCVRCKHKTDKHENITITCFQRKVQSLSGWEQIQSPCSPTHSTSTQLPCRGG